MKFKLITPIFIIVFVALLFFIYNYDKDRQFKKYFKSANEAIASTEPTSATTQVLTTPSTNQEISEATSSSSYTPLVWDDLLPDSWRPDPELVTQYERGEIDDSDERIIAFRKLLENPNPPANENLDGRKIQLSGYIVPLEYHEENVNEFLLVPFIGACIHVPPPPTNQTVYVTTEDISGIPAKMFDSVTVTGTIRIESTSSELAEAGYQMKLAKVIKDNLDYPPRSAN